MRRMVFSTLTLLLLATFSLAQGKSDSDLKQMAGTWKMVAEEFGGNKLTDEMVKDVNAKLIVKTDTFESHFGGKKVNSGKIKLDATKKPKTLDVIVQEGRGKGKTMKGIYKYEAGKLIVCFATMKADRPTKFETKAGVENVLITYEREKK